MKKLKPCCKRERARSLRIIATEARAREKIQTKEMAMGLGIFALASFRRSEEA